MARRSNPLFERWPKLASSIPFVSLGAWPTNVERLDKLDDLAEPVWIKREDLSSPVFGGNKVRKLEFLLAGPPRAVLTFGALGSHHALATAIHAKRLGHVPMAALFPQPMNEHHDAVARELSRCCDFVFKFDGALKSPARIAGAALAALGRGSQLRGLRGIQVIPPGASSARGTLGYVAAGMEIAEQVRSGECPAPKRVYVALGTGGTAAGLALGMALLGLDAELVAVRVASRLTGNREFLKLLSYKSMKILQKAGIEVEMPKLSIKVDDRFVGDGYACSTRASAEAVARAGDAGLLLETTYTGKAMAAVLADRESGAEAGPCIFVNTYCPIERIDRAVVSRRDENDG